MGDRDRQESIENSIEEMIVEEPAVGVTDQDSDSQVMFEELCEELEGVIPADIFEMIKQVRPLEAAIVLLWEYGGRIRTNQPEVDLKSDYDYPKEVNELNDVIGDFSFTIAPSPFAAIGLAVSGNINADEEIIRACDLKGYVPIIIKEGEEVKRICLIDFDSRKLEMPMGAPFNISIEMTGDQIEQSDAMAEGLKELKTYLDTLMQQMEEPPQLFDNQAEQEAITAWCKKHSYSVVGIFRTGIDCYH